MTPSQNPDDEQTSKKVPYHFGEKLRQVREHRGYYRVQMKTLCAEPKTSAEGEITTAYARQLEKNINEQPFLWLWSHDRWKWKRA